MWYIGSMNWEKFLSQGKNFVIPTDTVYGLTCDARSEFAVGRLFEIKGRPQEKAVPVFVNGVAMAKVVALVEPRTECFLNKIWPGKVNVVLQVRPDTMLAKNVYAPDGTVALRQPGHPVITEIFAQFPHPIVGTSANVSGQPASGVFKDAMAQWQGRALQPDEALDYGTLPVSLPSTIVKPVGERLTLLRAGAVDFKQLTQLWSECLR